MRRLKKGYMFTRDLQITILIAVLLLIDASDQTPEHEYLDKEIPPYTPGPGIAA